MAGGRPGPIPELRSDAEDPRAEPSALWVEGMEPEYWEQETRIFKEHTQNFRTCLQNLLRLYNQSQDGKGPSQMSEVAGHVPSRAH